MADVDAKNPKELAKKWMDRIRQADKREERWQEDAAAAEKAYLADRDSESPGKVYDFNILHSNVETIVPAIYNSTPVPDIRERFRTGAENEETNAARIVAQALERAIAVQIDDGRLDSEIEGVAQDGFTAGRGITRLRFDADVSQDELGQEIVRNERILAECVSWRDYREGPAMRWRDVPWVAYGAWISAEEIERIRDPEFRAMLGGEAPDAKPTLEQPQDEDARVWEIWCKDSRKVYLIAEAAEELIRVVDDPLGLPGFFPQPAPVQPITGTGKRTPVCPFAIYRKLAEELETITKRINALLRVCKARGLTVGDAAGLEVLATLDDGEIAPVANLEQLAQTAGLDKAILWWPIDVIVEVLTQLYVAREQTKAMIYEVTGISDIVRGQGEQGETATAQQIKTQWGSLRIKKLQRLLERHIRDLFVLYAEIISRHFSPETVAKMTGIEIPPEGMPLFGAPLDHYRIDVESDSTVRADLAHRREEMARFLEGSAQYFAAMAPIAQESPGATGPLAEIYGAFARQFSLGKQAEDAIEALIQGAKQVSQQPPKPSPEEQKLELEREKMQIDAQSEQQKAALEMQKAELDREIKLIDVELKKLDMAMKQQEAQFKAAEMQGKMQLAQQEHALKADEMQMDAEASEREHAMDAASQEREFEMEGERMKRQSEHEARMAKKKETADV